LAVDRIAGKLGLDRIAAAAGILRVANANMERAIRLVSVERGHDPRDFALVAFGGCGGLHACEIARELDIRTVIVPEHAGALSALGMLIADRTRDYAAGVLGRSGIEARFAALERLARRESPGARMERTADLRYFGQSYELNVPWFDESSAVAQFHRDHARIYGYAFRKRGVEVVTIRVRARVAVPKAKLARSRPRSGIPSERRIWLEGAWRRVPCWQRKDLGAGSRRGPALVLDYGSTTLIPPGWRFRADPFRNLVVEQV
jgi:N-methylhydantoinase A